MIYLGRMFFFIFKILIALGLAVWWIRKNFLVIHIRAPISKLPLLLNAPTEWLWEPNGLRSYEPQTNRVYYFPYQYSLGIFLWGPCPVLVQFLSEDREHGFFEIRMCHCLYFKNEFADFLNRVVSQMRIPVIEGTSIYALHDTKNIWLRRMRCPVRQMDKLCLKESIKQELVETISEFLNSEEWYRTRQIPYRMGLLLYGSQGNGKTSIIEALSERFHRDIYELDLAKCIGRDLSECLRRVPAQQFIVIEDLDIIVKNLLAQNPDLEAAHRAVIRQLLHVMDGLQAHTGSIIIVTASDDRDIPQEFKRGGRFDHMIHIGNPQNTEISKYFASFFPDSTEAEQQQFANIIAGKVPMCEIQTFLTIHRRDKAAAINHAATYFKAAEI